jgi:hypothetical protein
MLAKTVRVGTADHRAHGWRSMDRRVERAHDIRASARIAAEIRDALRATVAADHHVTGVARRGQCDCLSGEQVPEALDRVSAGPDPGWVGQAASGLCSLLVDDPSNYRREPPHALSATLAFRRGPNLAQSALIRTGFDLSSVFETTLRLPITLTIGAA